MKYTTILNFIFCTTFLVQLQAQKIQGIATYKVQNKIEVKLDSTMDRAMQQQIKDLLKKQSQKEFGLQFSENESVYAQVETLSAPTPNSSGIQMVFMDAGGNDKLYKNIKENKYINQVEFFGKQFLVKDTLEKRKWKLEKESKYIGEYPCFKATYIEPLKVLSSFESSDLKENKLSDNEVDKGGVITAWYTPQIPVQNGPNYYGGLPGLILEINTANLTILCSRIVLNPEKGIDIKEPTKGKEVSNTEYEEIIEKKLNEMQENFNGRSNGKEGNYSIKIGGK